MTTELCEDLIRQVFDSFPEEKAIMLPRLLDRALLACQYRQQYASRQELRQTIIKSCKLGGWLAATTEGIMLASEFAKKYGNPPVAYQLAADRMTNHILQDSDPLTDKVKEMRFFRASACENTCPKCSGPLPCTYH